MNPADLKERTMINLPPNDPVSESGQPASAEALPVAEDSRPVLLTSHEVLRGQKTVAITHNGALYRLQTTRQGKLILTK
ncbi:MAG: hemin uptake protein HemP [Hydrogenophaga sp.]|uniref:hemin uptake protein HemP n=1 Tax=Hydrogenophaga sp. TaxID=1904254 RepID=UPI00272F66E5|nr:hemin uptake protein HemP [Hydrogenophaga sp.]MDP2404656.1 hemin uptake protein HemP [Hydrogenophaga sp.]MDZ4174980.1 hemin uptake protein HemP [Hydrogenophaga sp.]